MTGGLGRGTRSGVGASSAAGLLPLLPFLLNVALAAPDESTVRAVTDQAAAEWARGCGAPPPTFRELVPGETAGSAVYDVVSVMWSVGPDGTVNARAEPCREAPVCDVEGCYPTDFGFRRSCGQRTWCGPSWPMVGAAAVLTTVAGVATAVVPAGPGRRWLLRLGWGAAAVAAGLAVGSALLVL